MPFLPVKEGQDAAFGGSGASIMGRLAPVSVMVLRLAERSLESYKIGMLVYVYKQVPNPATPASVPYDRLQKG
jgi:hypothetical protein